MADTKSRTRVLIEYPPDYPQRLVAETQLIVAEAVAQFPTLDQIFPLCRLVVRMTPVMTRETSGVRPDLVLMHMGDLVEYILIDHFLYDKKRQFDLKQEIFKSNEWLGLLRAVAEKCAAPMPEAPQEAPGPVPAPSADQAASGHLVVNISPQISGHAVEFGMPLEFLREAIGVRKAVSEPLPSLDYPKSPVKRAIRVILTNHPNFADRQVCLQLDEDGVEVSSSRLKTKARSFQAMYESVGEDKHRIEVMIGDVRGDTRKHGLLQD